MAMLWPLVALVGDPSATLVTNHFGHLALSGTGLCALAAAPGAAGTVYALTRPSLASPWAGISPPPALRIPAGATAAGTGLALPASCNVAAFVGAPDTAFSKGAVYTYAPCSTEPSGWCSMATLTVTDAGLPTFGKALAANGAGWALAVGAPNAGAAGGTGSTWFCTAAGLAPNATSWACERLPPPPASAQLDYTGSSVFLSDSAQVLVSAAPYRASQGAVFVYARAASGAAGGGGWALAASLDPSAPPCALAGSNRNFGSSLAGTPDGAILLVGSPLGGAQYGAATVFERNATGGYPCTALLRPSVKAYGDAVGSGVALSADGNTAFVSGTRTVHVFARAGGGRWAETGALRSPNQGAFNEDFGRRVAVSRSGLVGLVGAPGSSTAASAYAGYVALFDASNISPSSTPTGAPSSTATRSPTPSASAAGSQSQTPSPTPTGTATPTAGAPASASSSASDSATATPSATPTPSGTPSGSASDSETPTPTPTPSSAPPSASAFATASAPQSPATSPALATVTASHGASASPSSAGTPGGLTAGSGGSGGGSGAAQMASGALTPGATAGIALGVLALLGAGAGAALCAGTALCHARKAPLATSVLSGSAGSATVVMSPMHLHARSQAV